MKQLDLFTGKESAYHSEGWIISAVKSPDDLETYLSRLSVVDVGLYFLGKAVARRPVSGLILPPSTTEPLCLLWLWNPRRETW